MAFGIVALPSLDQFVSNADTTGIPSEVQNAVSRVLGLVLWVVEAILIALAFYYIAEYVRGERPEVARDRLIKVVIGAFLLYAIPKILDWIAGNSGGAS
ncbi:hypothetical protein [Pyrococcus kukulkanii]|uniref:Conjugal transfer protein n=1 Tax=Pyrococcus kukulkanii TaxID=1609559 RepID=A0ABV4T6D7_9EURY